MKRIGFLLPHLGNSQLAYEFCKSANEAVLKGIDVIGFYDSLTAPSVDAIFPLMHLQEAWGYDGILVAPTLRLADRLRSCPSSPTKFFYLWDLDWTRIPRANYHQTASIYRDESLRLVARSQSHVKAISDAWGRVPEAVIDRPDVSQFVSLVQ